MVLKIIHQSNSYKVQNFVFITFEELGTILFKLDYKFDLNAIPCEGWAGDVCTHAVNNNIILTELKLSL